MFHQLNVPWRLRYDLIRLSKNRKDVSERLQHRVCYPALTIAGSEVVSAVEPSVRYRSYFLHSLPRRFIHPNHVPCPQFALYSLLGVATNCFVLP